MEREGEGLRMGVRGRVSEVEELGVEDLRWEIEVGN